MKVVLASMPDMECGFARELFLQVWLKYILRTLLIFYVFSGARIQRTRWYWPHDPLRAPWRGSWLPTRGIGIGRPHLNLFNAGDEVMIQNYRKCRLIDIWSQNLFWRLQALLKFGTCLVWDADVSLAGWFLLRWGGESSWPEQSWRNIVRKRRCCSIENSWHPPSHAPLPLLGIGSARTWRSLEGDWKHLRKHDFTTLLLIMCRKVVLQ